MRHFALSFILASARVRLASFASILLSILVIACAPSPYDPGVEPARRTLESSESTRLARTPVPTGAFKIATDVFSEGGTIPKKYTCDGENVSLPLRWVGAPSGTRSFTLIMDDPDAPGGTFTHWVAFDLPGTQTEIAERAPSVGKGAKNGRGQTGYTGPCPPSGTHRYFFTLYALDVPSLGLQEGAGRTDVEKAMTGHILASTQTMGRYGR